MNIRRKGITVAAGTVITIAFAILCVSFFH
mgnify:CR=1 FL=1